MLNSWYWIVLLNISSEIMVLVIYVGCSYVGDSFDVVLRCFLLRSIFSMTLYTNKKKNTNWLEQPALEKSPTYFLMIQDSDEILGDLWTVGKTL